MGHSKIIMKNTPILQFSTGSLALRNDSRSIVVTFDVNASFLWNNFSIIEKNNGKAPLTYHQFQGIISSMDPPPLPESPVSLATIENVKSIIGDDHDEKYGVPTLEELGTEEGHPEN